MRVDNALDGRADQDPYRHTGYLLRRAQQLHVATWTRLVSADTTSVQYAILALLDRLGAASQRTLCDEADLDRSTIADILVRMERRGLVERTRDLDDRRRNAVTLTAEGRAEYERLRPRVNVADAELTGALGPEELTALRAHLRRMLASA